MGKRIEIRPIREEDAKDFIDMLWKLDEQTELMMYEIEGRSISEENMLSVIRTCKRTNSLLLIAIEEEKIVGFLGVARGRFKRNSHSGYITIGILEKYRQQGIGTNLFEEMEYWAKEENMVRLELTVMCHNTQAVRLYEKKGFFIEGIRKKSLYVKEKYIDEYYMGKIL